MIDPSISWLIFRIVSKIVGELRKGHSSVGCSIGLVGGRMYSKRTQGQVVRHVVASLFNSVSLVLLCLDLLSFPLDLEKSTD